MKIVYDLTPSLDRQLLFSHHFSNNSSLWFGTVYGYTNTVRSRLAPICTWNSFAHLAAYPVLCLYVKNFFFPFGISIEITLTWIYILRHSKSDILKYEQKDGIREKYSFDVEFKGHMHLINFPCSQTKMFRKKNMIQATNWTVDSWSICQMA